MIISAACHGMETCYQVYGTIINVHAPSSYTRTGQYAIALIKKDKYKKQLKGEVGMTVLKSTQTRFVGIMYHIHYTSLRLLLE